MTGAGAAPPFPIILAAPSGAGKTTIARALRQKRTDVEFSISATTRPPRPGERSGVDYHFLSRDGFQAMIDAGEFIEWAEVHGNLYGTPRRNVDEALSRGNYLLLDIDVQGSRMVREAVPEALSVFVLPPSGGELARRLAGRGTETAEVRERRLRASREELQAVTEFDYVIVNEDVDRSVAVVEAILTAEAHRRERIGSLGALVRRLQDEVDGYLASIEG